MNLINAITFRNLTVSNNNYRNAKWKLKYNFNSAICNLRLNDITAWVKQRGPVINKRGGYFGALRNTVISKQ